jgi:integrase/recombinase XerD
MSEKPISPLRRRMIEDMSVLKFGEKTQHDYIRHIESFAKFLGRSPDTATAEDLRRYQVHQTETGVRPPSVNSSSAECPQRCEVRDTRCSMTNPVPGGANSTAMSVRRQPRAISRPYREQAPLC